ncbi:uncharacterized protein LOC112041670, partial [Lingula anatina]|uniref:Uncharacterized protein LOC112041670 n=1 Tax=Lingula anatina TaxID=7574 RepID=A0A2R2ML66_LINAN
MQWCPLYSHSVVIVVAYLCAVPPGEVFAVEDYMPRSPLLGGDQRVYLPYYQGDSMRVDGREDTILGDQTFAYLQQDDMHQESAIRPVKVSALYRTLMPWPLKQRHIYTCPVELIGYQGGT